MRWMLFLVLLLGAQAADLQPTPAPSGPYRISANRILDRSNRPYLMRGTELAPVTLDALKSGDLGALSASALVTIRQRLNMNAVRLPFSAAEFQQDAAYRIRVGEIVRTANRLELLVILAPFPADASTACWTALAQTFRDNPNVFFTTGNAEGVAAIRAAHAAQPIIVEAGKYPVGDDDQIIYQVMANYADTRTEPARHAQFEALAARTPVLASGLDPQLNEDSAECAAFPADPADATEAVEANLNYFDKRQISWIISAFRPGKLITDTRYFDGTRLDDGWTCDKAVRATGIGLQLLAHLWHTDAHGLFTVNGDAGGFLMARGGRAATYGPTMADHETRLKPGASPPTAMDNISVRITDSLGVARLAPLLYAGAGWSLIHFVVPNDAAAGPAEIAVMRTDGSRSTGAAMIADVAPGLRSATSDGRGAAIGAVTQKLASGMVRTFDTFHCAGYDCQTVPILLAEDVSSTLRLAGSGFRHASSIADFQVMVGEVVVPVLSFGPGDGPGGDQVTVRLTDDLIGYGETDVLMRVRGVLSNVVRLNCGGKPNAKVLLGRYLFYDKRMSVNHTTSCATCHRQDLAFTDGRAQAKGATGELHPRSAMSLVNLASSKAYNWSDPTVHTLEAQALKPMFGTAPIELGLSANRAEFLAVLRLDRTYAVLFPQAFAGPTDPYTIGNVTQALAAFERTIVSKNSAWDRFHRGDSAAISESAKRGEILFFLDRGPSCFRCHNGPNFTDGDFHNTALSATDTRRFKTPTLRNIALTAPYMHDGSVATLEEAVDHYAAGGRARQNPAKDKLMHGFEITQRNRADLVAFLQSLTDEELIRNPRFSDPRN
jgi:cytochrome c peroxidase